MKTKTIKERAKEYASKRGDISLSPVYNKALASIYEEGYIAGATEQKTIDDAKLLKLKSSWEKQAQINHDDVANYKQGYHDAKEKFREWLKNNWREYVYQDGDGIIHFGHWESDFRKAIEK